MQFFVLAYDGTDEEAPNRRQAVREAHLKGAETMHREGSLLSACAILDETGAMIGSMVLVDFPSREAMEREWLSHEPYLLGDVWRTVEISPCRIPPFCL